MRFLFSFRNNKIFSRLLISLFLVCFLTVIILPSLAQAQGEEIGDALSRAKTQEDAQKAQAAYGFTGSTLDSRIPIVGQILGVILYAIKWLLGKLVYTAGMLLDGVLGIKNFTQVSTVQHGWTVVRDLCNMLFALILLIIAFATILHLESYGMKQLLWRLVVAAILINFSFTLAGVIIDFSQVLTNFFVDNSKNATTGGQISATIILQGLEFDKLFNFQNQQQQGILTTLANWTVTAIAGPTIGTLIDMLLIIILEAVAVFAILGLVILFLVRIVVLWVILIFAPLAWLCMVLPATKSIWNSWWNYLLKYSFFAPFATFMLYLAIILIQNGDMTNMLSGQQISFNTQQAQYFSQFLNNPRFILQYILVVGLLLASVLIARNMGIWGAGAVINMGRGVKNLALGAIAGGTLGAGAWAGRRALVATSKSVANTGAQWAATAEKWRTQPAGFWQRAAKTTGAAWLVGQASRLPTMYAERAKQEIAKQKKAYASWSTESKIREITVASPAARAALLESMGADVSALPDSMKKYLPEFERIGGDLTAVMPYRPEWGKDDKDVEHWVSEAIRTGAQSKWNAATVGNIKVLDAWRNVMPSASAYAANINRFSGEVRNTILKTLENNFSTNFNEQDEGGKLNLRRRKAYARATGDIQISYQDTPANKQIAITGPQAEAVKKYIQDLSAAQLGAVESGGTTGIRNAELLARHMTDKQAISIQGEIKGKMKEMIMEQTKIHNKALHKVINKLPFWNLGTPARGGQTSKP